MLLATLHKEDFLVLKTFFLNVLSLFCFLSPVASLRVTSLPRGEVTLQIGSPLILTCEILGLPFEVNSGLLVRWMKRGSTSSDSVGTGGVEVMLLLLFCLLVQTIMDLIPLSSNSNIVVLSESKCHCITCLSSELLKGKCEIFSRVYLRLTSVLSLSPPDTLHYLLRWRWPR